MTAPRTPFLHSHSQTLGLGATLCRQLSRAIVLPNFLVNHPCLTALCKPIARLTQLCSVIFEVRSLLVVLRSPTARSGVHWSYPDDPYVLAPRSRPTPFRDIPRTNVLSKSMSCDMYPPRRLLNSDLRRRTFLRKVGGHELFTCKALYSIQCPSFSDTRRYTTTRLIPHNKPRCRRTIGAWP